MKVVLQRVAEASVTVEGETIGSIGRGFLLLLEVSDTDTEQTADKMADKICKLRIFEDENGKTNLSLADVGGALLVISQFTLYADCKKRGTVPALYTRERPGGPMSCMSILSAAADSMWIRWSMEALERI